MRIDGRHALTLDVDIEATGRSQGVPRKIPIRRGPPDPSPPLLPPRPSGAHQRLTLIASLVASPSDRMALR